uniref:Large ribosomal subunit protein uL11 n=1 Tax=Tetracapsuloides bryosalmonae TaxID=271932 RepID=A0A859IR99_9CNID|nr:ribosomal protein L-12 [Tetracapsuloides bryosalmonae]
MPPKPDASVKLDVYVKCVGGEAAATTALAPKVGPLGLPPKKIADDIAAQTKDYKGLKVMVKLEVQNRQAAITVIPSAPCLIIKALKEPPRDRKKVKNIKHNGSITYDSLLEIARFMRARSSAREFKGTVKEIVGSCVSVGCLVDGQTPKAYIEKINSGEISIPNA